MVYYSHASKKRKWETKRVPHLSIKWISTKQVVGRERGTYLLVLDAPPFLFVH